MQKCSAFTLIELLIVVAIIGILAAIAVPNFLNAQIRAKVSRVQAEFKTASTAMETYRLDQNAYAAYMNPLDRVPAPHFMPLRLTTPISYLSNLFDEVFPAKEPPPGIPSDHPFHYFNRKQSPGILNEAGEGYFQKDEGAGPKRSWFMFSHGPDVDDDDVAVPYDPSNGITSNGDIAFFGP